MRLGPAGFSVEPVSESDWDARLLAAADPHPLQSSSCAAALAGPGARVLRLEIRTGREAAGWCSMVVDSGGMAQWFYGPVMPHGDAQPEALVLSALLHALPRFGIRGIAYATTHVRYDGEPRRWRHSWCARSGATPVVNLRCSAEALFESYDASVRKNVRKCQRAGMRVDITDQAPFVARYAKLVRAYRERLSLPLPALFPQERLLAHFAGSTSRMLVALAQANGEDVAGLGLVIFGRTVVEFGVAQAGSYEARKLPAHDFIKFAVAAHGQAHGLSYYDLAGIRRGPGSAKEANIRRFKMKFTSQCAEFRVIDRETFSMLAPARRAVRRLKHLLPAPASHA
jgi:hypothetical protein